MIKDLAYLVPEISLLVMNLLMMVFSNNRAFSFLSVFSVLVLCVANFSPIEPNLTLFNGLVTNSPKIEIAKILILAFASLILLMIPKKDYKDEIPVLIIFSTIGTMIVASSGNFISLYLGLELQSLTSYVLATHGNRNQSSSSEAGMKYFVLGAIASGLALYGISMIYGACGSTSFSANCSNGLWMAFGLAMVLSGMAFKAALAPFHIWVADVFQGASTVSAAFFATVPKIGLLIALERILSISCPDPSLVKLALLYLAVLSVVVSALGGLVQTDLKRLVAYSSIGHLGYIVSALVTGHPLYYMLYLAIYIFTSLGLFSFFLGRDRHSLTSLSGLSKSNPILAFSISVLVLSMAGIPPLAGFFIKFDIIMALIAEGFVWQSLLMLAMSTISVYYYARIVKVMYFESPSPHLSPRTDFSIFTLGILGMSVVINLMFFAFHRLSLSVLGGLLSEHWISDVISEFLSSITTRSW